MKNISLIIFLLLIGNYCFSQGGWNIGYVSIDSISQNLIGRDVKLDFRKESDTTNSIPSFLMNFIAIEDSTSLLLDGEEIVLTEKRNIHSDWGFYDEQFLECIDFNKSESLRIYHSVIEEQNEDSLLVRLYIEIYYKYTKRKERISPDRRYCISQWIPKDKLNGVMIKE
ncbi:hypothetical protein [Patiriisocius sp. Uisw_017]|jgi:hypothetical protein|uniref:hypothetical protein n=1 Tax=Patiriisocius sp. Uisw_017 TaxID=3230968 RepID=UPI0039EA3AF8